MVGHCLKSKEIFYVLTKRVQSSRNYRKGSREGNSYENIVKQFNMLENNEEEVSVLRNAKKRFGYGYICVSFGTIVPNAKYCAKCLRNAKCH